MEEGKTYDLKKAQEMLEKVSELIAGSIQFVPRDVAEFDRSSYVLKAGYVLTYLLEMQNDILAGIGVWLILEPDFKYQPWALRNCSDLAM